MRQIAGLRQVTGRMTCAAWHARSAATRSTPSSSSLNRTRGTTVPSTLAQTPNPRFLSTSTRRCENKDIPRSLEDQSATNAPATEDEGHWDAETAEPLDTTKYRPPPLATDAENPESISDPAYIPATTADDLETVGGIKGWWDKSANYSQTFSGFKPRRKISDPKALTLAVRRAVVEALALQQTGIKELLVGSWPLGGAMELERALSVTISPDGKLSGDIQAIVADLQSRGDSPAVSPSSKSSIDHGPEISDAAWQNVLISDIAVKFAVAKRVFQLTGQRIPDFQLENITDVKSILAIIQKAPKARTLAQEIQTRRPELFEIPNITFAAKRVTRGDKDKSLGRFKVIEEEFKKRDLPTKGHEFAERNKELQRHDGWS